MNIKKISQQIVKSTLSLEFQSKIIGFELVNGHQMVIQSNSQATVQEEARVNWLNSTDNLVSEKRTMCRNYYIESEIEQKTIFLYNIYFKSSIKNINPFLDNLKMENILNILQCLASELDQMYMQLDEYFCNLFKMKQIQSKINEYKYEKKISIEHKKSNLDKEEIKNEKFKNKLNLAMK
ncbi:hypothetical protein RFI_03103 [Reticulomyxa filosa]|uniref:Uncharacterized protein n=1 Tax=Reticulomyxa filosa TaxID=46433 RepID=X6P717_RETFI|nr:hypothetical protein RFI_03103 [Reticulomyxa filosa]|eukprot:ETO33991.1 hypothetical protein RFI_03103 [Reticulomyxa filosa]